MQHSSGALPPPGRQPGSQPGHNYIISDQSSVPSYLLTTSPSDRLPPRSMQPTSREVSTNRGRGYETTNAGVSALHRAQSPHVQTNAPGPARQQLGIGAGLDGTATSYGHHRQTSIVHGIQHSRTTSFATSSPASSPLSPEIIASAGLGNQAETGPNGLRLDLPDFTSAQLNPYAGSPPNGQTDHFEGVNSTRKLDRNHHSLKKSRDHVHHSSHSKHHKQESRTVNEYALHHLFTSFVAQADQKIDQIILSYGEIENPVEQICGPGADSSLDQLITALGHIARQKPKLLIDTMIYWRKEKGDRASRVAQNSHQTLTSPVTGPLSRKPADTVTSLPTMVNGSNSIPHGDPMLARGDEVLNLERHATVSSYLVCRVLTEVVEQCTLGSMGTDVADRLEDVFIDNVMKLDAENLSGDPLRMANWRAFSLFFGAMSNINFRSITERFLAELDKFQKDGASTSPALQTRLELLILSMRYLRVKTAPEEDWNRTCTFMSALAGLFVSAHGYRVKQAYCSVLEKLLSSIAAAPNQQLNGPKWRAFLDIINPRVSQLLTKPRYWHSAYPLGSLLLCLAPKELFVTQWSPAVSSLPAKLKDRLSRSIALQAICRLVWTYINRKEWPDGPQLRTRKLEDVIKVVLPQGKKTYLSADRSVAEPLIQLIRVIGFENQELCFRTIIFPLINSELFVSGRDLKIEQMEPEKIVIGIRSFLAIMSDLEQGEQGCPPFPQSFGQIFTADNLPTSPRIYGPRSLSEAKAATTARLGDQLARPVNTLNFGASAKEYYARFCETLGKITILCDNTFGGQATLDEKFSGLTPKTPITDAFSFKRDEHAASQDPRQGFYDLLHVAVQALPRCLSDHIPFNPLINLLCTGTAHMQSNIAVSSAQSLKSIARQSHAMHVTIGFARFIFSFDARYSTMSEEGMLGPGHIENTLKLYVELLEIWIEEIRKKNKEATAEPGEKSPSGSRALQLDLSGVLAHVDEVESHGLFFLCSQSRRVRRFAITVLRLVTEFDKALGKENTRIIRILEDDSNHGLNFHDDQLKSAERARLQRGKKDKAAASMLIEICGCEDSVEVSLWSKIFPNIVRISFQTVPFAVTLGREIVCARLHQMHRTITMIIQAGKSQGYSGPDQVHNRSLGRNAASASEIIVEQWKLYLIMACTTMTNAGAQSQSQLANAQHARKISKDYPPTQQKISSARQLFASVIPLLNAATDSVRDAIVVALGSININLYRTLLESLQYAVTTCNEDAKLRISPHHVRTPSGPRREGSTDRLRTEVTHVYKLTSRFLTDPEVYNNDWILNNLVTYTKELRLFLSDAEIQTFMEFQKLRLHFCGLMEEVFEGINRSKNPSRWLPFESRKSAFALMEDWCGSSPNQVQMVHRDDAIRLNYPHQDTPERPRNVLMEIEKKELKTAALSAMASLCGGPVSIKTQSDSILQFDVRRMFTWIETIFRTISDKFHTIGRRALKNLIIHNKEYPDLLEHAIEMCYISEAPRALESYFEVVTQVLIEHTNYPLDFWKILGLVLFTLGNEQRVIRMKSARLLRTLEERQQMSSKLQDFDISISDKTTAVYKLAQFETSKRLSKQHSELAFLIFSEFTRHFRKVRPDYQRNMVAAILPWIQIIELQVDPNGGPTARSFMLLSNLLEVTISSSSILHNEVQALWQALATGPHAGNVQLVLDFIITLCLERREQNFVEFAKQIVVFLSSTPAGSKVIEFLLLQMTPRNMVHDSNKEPPVYPDIHGFPYVADLTKILPIGNKQTGFALGQVSMIFLVDLMIAPIKMEPENLPKLLHVVLVLWDHYTPTVREHAREMLVHLLHELMISSDGDEFPERQQTIEDFVDSIRRKDPALEWQYDDNNENDPYDGSIRVPTAMSHIVNEIVVLFGITDEGLNDHWSRLTLNWATSCPVQHLACRSFQIFRCISTSLDSMMLADMLARLSNTIADETISFQTFSMEILTTLRTIISSLVASDLLRYPQLFWITCACLDTTHEREFMECLRMLETFLDKVDIGDAAIVGSLLDSQPPRWQGKFEGIQPLLYKGLKSSEAMSMTLSTLQKLTALPNNELLGHPDRLLFTVLANLPGYLRHFDATASDQNCFTSALLLADVAEDQLCHQISQSLRHFGNGPVKNRQEWLLQIVSAIKSHFFPDKAVQSLIFLMGLLTNTSTWLRLRTIEILCVLIPEIDMRQPELSCYGPDLISPLLRLLQTDLCAQALDVLDQIMTVSGNPLEKQHIRMSMPSSAAREIRKEYDRTQSLYGIPETTGWSIPMPAVHSKTTRDNVHAVFYTCADDPERMEAQAAATPEVEFQAEEYRESYFPNRRTATMKSVDTQNDGNMGDLVKTLDSLDDFFEETVVHHDTNGSIAGSTLRGYSTELHDPSANYYDQQTAPILRKTLNRTASSSSFQSGFMDPQSRPSTSRDPLAMTPTAFVAPSSSVAALPSARPSMHSRAATTPANNFSNPSMAGLTEDELDLNPDPGTFSDSDDRLMITPSSNPPTGSTTPDGSFSIENMIRGTRSGLRRLTGGGSTKEKERQRDLLRAQHRTAMQTAGSPRVPKVPAEYLQGSPTSPGV